MREIKFRYRYTDGKDWLFSVFTLAEICNGEPFEFLSDNPLLKRFKHVGQDQFTGLTDKNRVEIYEGDYVIAANGSKCVVMFGEWKYDFGGEYDNIWNGIGFYWDNGEPFGAAKNNGGLLFEVIGNIYENPDL